jgi:hypothetical protein
LAQGVPLIAPSGGDERHSPSLRPQFIKVFARFFQKALLTFPFQKNVLISATLP